ncbi:MAG: hypothetical protein ACPGJR_13365 [Akkermansiaceae bacterium]
MKWIFKLALVWCLWIIAYAQTEKLGEEQKKKEEEESIQPQLPNWNEHELRDLESGNYVPGSSLIGKLAREILESDKVEVIVGPSETEALTEEVKVDPRLIPEDALPGYLVDRPTVYLMDPQKLLTSQETTDLETSLGFHVQQVSIPIYLYLFDTEQELPEVLDLAGLVEQKFDPEKPAAVVFYFRGAPDRADLCFTRRIEDLASEAEMGRVKLPARTEAGEMSDATSQLDVFATQLSDRLAVLEKTIVEKGGQLIPDEMKVGDSLVLEAEQKSWWSSLAENEAVFWTGVGIGVCAIAALLGSLGSWISSIRSAYIFPDAEGSTLFDAPHAAGVGGVLSFSSSQTPPSRQESDVPDYLQRM